MTLLSYLQLTSSPSIYFFFSFFFFFFFITIERYLSSVVQDERDPSCEITLHGKKMKLTNLKVLIYIPIIIFAKHSVGSMISIVQSLLSFFKKVVLEHSL